MSMAKVVLAQDETIIIASAQSIVNPAEYILDSTAIAPGSAAVLIDGQTVSADPAKDLFINGAEVLTGYPTASFTSIFASASTTAFSNSVMSGVDDSSSGSGSSGSQLTSIGSGSMSASSALGSFPTILSQHSNITVPATSTATGSNHSDSVIPWLVSTGLTLHTNKASSASSIAPNGNVNAKSASSASSIAPGLDTNINSASSASHSSRVASVAGSSSRAGTNVSPTGSNTFVQSNKSTGLAASVTGVTSLSSNGTSFVLGSPSTRLLTSSLATAITALGLSNTVSPMTVASSSIASLMPASITSGPTISMPIITVEPTGSVASAAGISLGGLIVGISQEAQTLSNIVTNSASSSSYVLKIQAVESKWDNFFRQVGGDNPPSYDSACTGGGLTGLLELVGCISSGLDKIRLGIEGIDKTNPGPALTDIEEVIANVAEMAQEEEEEEEEEERTQNESQAHKTQESTRTPSISVGSSTLSSSAILSSVSSSVSSSAVSSGIMTDPPCDTNIPQALPSGYSIDNGAAEVVLGFVGDILL
ncbi:hypothetical protein HO173_011513 [Letharia columbiana]|uniref:Uncharacterized protein n=1 Tax=Letharia columbiana TaxID=112416 RepID=A0A8H6FJ66_9LECA|nr:uncharacterized protein HO173_011513 [Letharia columbiana]KAF6229473.1 hypothetical protein HO173_011513 [Letharia columbiana]